MRAESRVERFAGRIAGFGSTSGVRVVVGRWDETPYGSFADVMVEDAGGHRVLLAPSAEVAELLQQTYTFDEVVLGPVTVTSGSATEATDRARSAGERWRVVGPGLEAVIETGRRTLIGRGLALLPRRLATAPGWLRLINPVARLVLDGVRTHGTAGNGRTESYGAYDVRTVVAAGGSWRGVDLGDLARVEPAVRFGFGSTPAAPAVTSLVTTIRWPRDRPTG